MGEHGGGGGSIRDLFITLGIKGEAHEKLQEMVDWKLAPQHLDDFVWAWAEFDDGSGTISPEGFLLVSGLDLDRNKCCGSYGSRLGSGYNREPGPVNL